MIPFAPVPRKAARFPAFSKRPSILFVCTANICRSPMAEGVLRRLLARRARDADIDSAGTHDYRLGMPPFPMAVKAAKKRGYDITRLVARQVQPRDLAHFDIIVAMDRSHRDFLAAMAAATQRDKIRLLLEFSRRYPGEEVDDPYGGTPLAFEQALDKIEDGCRGLARLVCAATAPNRKSTNRRAFAEDVRQPDFAA